MDPYRPVMFELTRGQRRAAIAIGSTGAGLLGLLVLLSIGLLTGALPPSFASVGVTLVDVATWTGAALMALLVALHFQHWRRTRRRPPALSLFRAYIFMRRGLLVCLALWSAVAAAVAGVDPMNDGDISPSGWGTLLGCLALGVLLGLALQLYGHAVLRPRLRALLERGERAEATVVERWEEIDDSVRHSVIRYRFAPPAGPVVERAEFVDEHTERCHTGAQVPVYYLPERPNVSMLAPHYQETQRLRL